MLVDYSDLYQREDPPPLERPYQLMSPIFKIDDETPTKGDIEAEVRRMRRNIQHWLREEYPAETSTVLPNPTRWIKLVEIIQFMWETGSILK